MTEEQSPKTGEQIKKVEDLAFALENELGILAMTRPDFDLLYRIVGLRSIEERHRYLWPKVLVAWYDAFIALAGTAQILERAVDIEEGEVQ